MGHRLNHRASALILLTLLSLAQRAAAQQDSPRDWPPPPKPGCDSFSMQTIPRLSFAEKTCYWRGQLFTPSGAFSAAFFSAIALAQHSPKEWPEGAQGFGYQFGTRHEQMMLKNTTTFLIGAALHEDPRPRAPYDRACAGHQHYPQTTFRARLGVSLLRVVWTHHDDSCKDMPAFSRLGGSLASGFIQLAYLPKSQNTIGNAFLGSASGLGGYAANSVFTEFQGDLFGWIGKMFATGKPKTK